MQTTWRTQDSFLLRRNRRGGYSNAFSIHSGGLAHAIIRCAKCTSMQPPEPVSAELLARLVGRVATGIGQGAAFTNLDWARRQFIEHAGIDPHPGTLNLLLDEADHRLAWHETARTPLHSVWSPESDACAASLFPISLRHGADAAGALAIPAAVVLPEVADYPGHQLEIIAAINLREHFALEDGARLTVELLRPKVYSALIFDVDGTLLNSLDAYQLAASRATEPYGYEVTHATVCQALDGNIPFWDIVLPPDGAQDLHLIDTLRAATLRHFPAALAEVVSVLPGTQVALDRLRQAGIRLAIYTGSGGESFPPLRDAGLLDYFDVIVTGDQVKRRKPDPEGVIQCLDKLGITPRAAAYIGDSCVDVGASHAAGVTSFGVLTGAGSSASLSAAGTHRVLPAVHALPDVLGLSAGAKGPLGQ
jgi:phosphoglycolate phosphatase